jgi:hypothetical protein
VHKLVAAEWLRMGRHWLSWTLLALLIVILVFQVNGKLNQLAQLEREVETGLARNDAPLTSAQIEGNRYEIALLQRDLRYPTFIGYAARLARPVRAGAHAHAMAGDRGCPGHHHPARGARRAVYPHAGDR